MKGFFLFITRFSALLGAGGIVLICSISAVVLAVIFLGLTINGKSARKVIRIILSITGGYICLSLALLLANENLNLTDMLVALFCIFSVHFLLLIPLLISGGIKQNKTEDKPPQKRISSGDGYAFLHALEQKLKEEREEEIIKESVVKTAVLRCKEEQENKMPTVNYAHVKSVIKRVNGYDLSATDKRAVRELEIAVYDSENNPSGKEERARLNDGLNALLKIMAKYGV